MKRRINSIGVWCRKHLSKPDQIIARLNELNLDDVSLVLNAGVEPVYKSRVSPRHLWPLTRKCHSHQITPWWMCFPHSTNERVAIFLEDMAHLLDAPTECRPAGIEIDAENKHDRIGWGPSGTRLAKVMLRGLKTLGVSKIYVTCVIFRSGLRRQDMALIEAANELGLWVGLAPQAYSKDDPNKTWDNGELFRPGVMQSFVMDVCGPLVEAGTIDELRMGGMVAFQNHPDPWPDDREALEVAHDTAYLRGCRAWRYWALDQVGRADGDEAFLKEAPSRVAEAEPEADVNEGEAEAKPEDEGEPEATKRSKIKELQTRLVKKGYHPGPIDGLIGPRTKGAIEQYTLALRFVPRQWSDDELNDLIGEFELWPTIDF